MSSTSTCSCGPLTHRSRTNAATGDARSCRAVIVSSAVGAGERSAAAELLQPVERPVQDARQLRAQRVLEPVILLAVPGPLEPEPAWLLQGRLRARRAGAPARAPGAESQRCGGHRGLGKQRPPTSGRRARFLEAVSRKGVG